VLAEVKDLSPHDEAERQGIAGERGSGAAHDFRAVAPAVMSFAQGRRR
jgi:hypothetical protein